MFILYQDIALKATSNKGDIDLHRGDVVKIFNGKNTEEYRITHLTPYMVVFFDYENAIKHHKPGDGEFIYDPDMAYDFLNKNKTFNSPKYYQSKIINVWMIYCVESREYYYIGDRLRISSRRLNLNQKDMIFKGVTIDNEDIEIIFEDNNCMQYRLTNSQYNGNTSSITELSNGVPFYSDMHCEPKHGISNTLFGGMF